MRLSRKTTENDMKLFFSYLYNIRSTTRRVEISILTAIEADLRCIIIDAEMHHS